VAVDWIGKIFEGPETAPLVGLSIEDARPIAYTMSGITIVEEMGSDGTYTFDHREDRVRLLVIDGVVAAAARC
jgi:hypothetical protein